MDGNMAVAARAYRLRKSTRYWYGQGDRRYTLSSELWAWLEHPPQPRRLPPLILSAEEKAAIDQATQERQRMIRYLDRAAALEKWGPLPERSLTDASMQEGERAPLAAGAKAQVQTQTKKVSDAALRQCLLAIVDDRAKDRPDSPPPGEETLIAEVERRLGTTVSRDRIRQVRDEVASDFKLPPGRPRKHATK